MQNAYIYDKSETERMKHCDANTWGETLESEDELLMKNVLYFFYVIYTLLSFTYLFNGQSKVYPWNKWWTAKPNVINRSFEKYVTTWWTALMNFSYLFFKRK